MESRKVKRGFGLNGVKHKAAWNHRKNQSPPGGLFRAQYQDLAKSEIENRKVKKSQIQIGFGFME